MRTGSRIAGTPGPAAGLVLAGILAMLWLLAAACSLEIGGQASPAEAPPAGAPPVIDHLRIFENVYTGRQTDFPLGSSVAVCFAMTVRESRRSLTLVLSDGPEPPPTAFAAQVLGRSASIPARDGSGCYVVRLLRAPDPTAESRAYTVWVMRGSEALAQESFRALAGGTASAAPPGAAAAGSSPQAPVPSAPPAALRRGTPLRASGAPPGRASPTPPSVMATPATPVATPGQASLPTSPAAVAAGPDGSARARQFPLPGIGTELRATLVEQPTPSPAGR